MFTNAYLLRFLLACGLVVALLWSVRSQELDGSTGKSVTGESFVSVVAVLVGTSEQRFPKQHVVLYNNCDVERSVMFPSESIVCIL